MTAKIYDNNSDDNGGKILVQNELKNKNLRLLRAPQAKTLWKNIHRNENERKDFYKSFPLCQDAINTQHCIVCVLCVCVDMYFIEYYMSVTMAVTVCVCVFGYTRC